MPTPTRHEVRAALLEAAEHWRPQDQVSRSNWQAGAILDRVERKFPTLGRGSDFEVMVLDEWSELFRTGHLVWGQNLNNPNAPFFHVSTRGELALTQLSRDPVNPLGYLAYLDAEAQLSPIAKAYIEEGSACFNDGLHRAAAVMIGGCVEALAVKLRDQVIARLETLSQPVPRCLMDRRPAVFTEATAQVMDGKKAAMPPELRRDFEAHWSTLVAETRRVRNDTGHPKAIAAIRYEEVHAVLLTVPIVAKLARQLGAWVTTMA